MAKILIEFAHPVFSKSRVQKELVNRCREIEGITFNDLYEQYPDLYIDVKREQELLHTHDIIIWQHPMYWYSGPAILKQWMDLVLEYNWAYGPQGDALSGKKVLSVISCGVRESAYNSQGMNRYEINQFLLPFRQTATLCGMSYLPPFIIFGGNQISNSSLTEHSDKYAAVLSALAKDQLPEEQYLRLDYLQTLDIDFLQDKKF